MRPLRARYGLYAPAMAGLLFAGPAFAQAPLTYLTSNGPNADAIRPLTWALIAVSVIVCLIIGGLVLAGVFRRPGLALPEPGSPMEVGPEGGGLSWLWIGVGLSSVVLVASIVWTVAVLAHIARPPAKPDTHIEVTAHQWWWQVNYVADDPALDFETANEIHIPVGRPVAFKLIGGDVIHSFWVPQLAGKTDLIPGQTNEMWLEASKPGVYRGQCAEYCGIEHAHMAFVVVAQSPEDFARWRAHQLQAPPAPTGQAARGAEEFQMHCGGCHSVSGTQSGGDLGPNLSHLMQRRTLAAGMLPNDAAHLAQWISDPQNIKPGVNMQDPKLSRAELSDVLTYLVTLQ